MEQQNKPKWYKRKGPVISMIVGGIFVLTIASSNSTPATTSTYTPTVQSPTTNVQYAPAATSDKLSNNNSYVNTSGNTVHSPAYSNDNSVPAGASAQCRDGTYSFSQSRRGTCSHHGGVASWL